MLQQAVLGTFPTLPEPRSYTANIEGYLMVGTVSLTIVIAEIVQTFTPQPFKGSFYCFHLWHQVWLEGDEKILFRLYVKCMKLILGRNISWDVGVQHQNMSMTILGGTLFRVTLELE